MPFVLVFPPGHALEQRERVSWADVNDYPFIALQGQFTERLLHDMHVSFRELSLSPYNEVTFMTTALAMVSAKLGITVCLPYAEPMVKLYGLQMRLLQDPELTRRFSRLHQERPRAVAGGRELCRLPARVRRRARVECDAGLTSAAPSARTTAV